MISFREAAFQRDLRSRIGYNIFGLKIWLFICKGGVWAQPAGSDMMEELPVHPAFLSDFFLAGVTLNWTAAHVHLLGMPVDLWVMLLEPGEAKDDVLLSQADCKGGVFGWSLNWRMASTIFL